jgi:hypothetical protein
LPDLLLPGVIRKDQQVLIESAFELGLQAHSIDLGRDGRAGGRTALQHFETTLIADYADIVALIFVLQSKRAGGSIPTHAVEELFELELAY